MTTDIGIKLTAVDMASAVLNKVADSAGKVKDSIGGISTSFTTLAGTAIAGLSALSFGTKIKEAIDLGDSMNKLSQKTGVAVDELSKLNYAAGLADVSSESLNSAIKKLNVNISAAASGSKEQAAIFKALGINVKDAAGNALSADKVLAQLADRFSESADGAKKTAIAVALLGKNGADLIPLLNGGAGALKEMGDEAKKLGIVLDADFAKNAEAFKDNIHKVQIAGQGLAISLAGDFVKGVGDAASAMANAAVEGGKLAGIIAGIQTLFTGTDQYKNDKALVEQTERMLQLQNQYDKQRNGKSVTSQLEAERTKQRIADLQREIDTTMSYRKVLQDLEDTKAKATKPTPTKDSKAVSGAAAAIASPGAGTISEYQRLNQEISDNIKLTELSLDTATRKSAADKKEVELISKIKNQYDNGKITAKEMAAAIARVKTELIPLMKAEEDRAAATKRNIAAYQAYLDVQKELDDAYVADSKAREQGRLAVDNYVKTVEEETALLELETSLIGATADVRDRVLAQYKIELELKKQLRAIDENTGFDEAQREEERAKARAAAVQASANVETRIAVDAWKDASNQISNSITDALMRGFESGKGFVENLRDTIVNIFSTMVLRPIVQATVMGALGAGSAAAQAGQGGGIGTVGNVVGMAKGAWDTLTGGGVTQWFTDFTRSAQTGIADVGRMLVDMGGDKIGSFLTKNSGAIGDFVSTAGNALGYLDAAVAASEGKWGKSIGAAAGTYFFGPLGGAIGGSIGSFVDGLFDGHGYVSSTGDSARYYNKDGSLKSNTTSTGQSWWNNTAGANNFVDSIQSKYLATAKGLGIGTVATEFSFGSNNSDGGKFSLGGGASGTPFGISQGETKTTDEAVKLAANRAVFAALQGSDLPKYLKGIFDGLDANTISNEQINNAIEGAAAFKALHDNLAAMPFDNLKDLSYTALKGLTELSGGIDKFGANLISSAKNYTTAEQQKQTTLNFVGTSLKDAGYAGPMPTDRVQYAGLLAEASSERSLDTESGRKFYATLLSLGDAFASVTPSIDDMANAIKGVKDSVASSIFDMQYGMGTNMEKYNMLDVKGAGLDAKMRSSTDIIEIAQYAQDEIKLINQAWSLLDAQQQKNSYAEFERRLQEIDDYVTSQGADVVSVQKAKDDKTAKTIGDAVETGIANGISTAAQQISDAAVAINEAADKPAVAEVRLSVTKSPGVEVSIA